MRIIQTFWSGARNPIIKSYGWPHAEYNLISWALSCCLLREYYNEVILYTDQQGYEILIEKLNLPYTEVHIVYDDNLCLPQHWAYAKIKTYSMQTEPFLHIDGDVYITQELPQNIIQANLVAQNREIPTNYYKGMLEKILGQPRFIPPKVIAKDLEEGKILSCNMGIFGGNDIKFIQEYCQEVFHFFENNHLNSELHTHSKLDCNIFFEQILFAMMSDNKGKKITYVSRNPTKDNGYTADVYCDIESMKEKPFLHIIGGHKKGTKICEMLTNAILYKNAGIYSNILAIFPYKNKRFETRAQERITLTTERLIAKYEDLINLKRKEWEKIPNKEILEWNKKGANSLYKFNTAEEKGELIFSLHPCFFIYEMASTWPEEALMLIRNRVKKDRFFYLKGVLLSPSLENKGIKETALSCIGYQTINIIKKEKEEFKDILEECLKGFPKNENVLSDAKEFIINEIAYLIRSRIIFVQRKKRQT